MMAEERNFPAGGRDRRRFRKTEREDRAVTVQVYVNYGMKTPRKPAQYSVGAPLEDAEGYDFGYLILPEEMNPRRDESGGVYVTLGGAEYPLGEVLDVDTGLPVLRIPGGGESIPLKEDCMPMKR